MQTMDQDIARLWMEGRIDEQTAIAAARSVPAMKERANFLRNEADSRF
jgi:Tfp pilus assembly ATPase PilU